MTNESTHVLLIEDNPGDADLIRLRLVEANSDLSVSCVNRLSTGLASMIVSPPAMVLLDLNLPDSHGAETYRTVLKETPGVPIVVLSGLDDEELAVNAVHQGVQDYLVKGSFDSKQLARAMRYAIERQALLTSLDMSRRQQLQFKNEFLSHVSHELRTPLTCIHQFVTLMLDGLAGQGGSRTTRAPGNNFPQRESAASHDHGPARSHPRRVGKNLRRAAMHRHRRCDPARRSPCCRPRPRPNTSASKWALDIRIPFVYADPNRVLQVLTNLLDNASKFTQPDGSVMVKACLKDNDPEFVQISVTDTGRGISPEAKALIFERLYQDPNSVDDSRKGLGLGLYISKELVRLHGGQIWVESQLSHGSTFVFTLPLFSLAKFLTPVITHHGRLRESLSLITVEIAPLQYPLHRQLGRNSSALPAASRTLHSRRQGRNSAGHGPHRIRERLWSLWPRPINREPAWSKSESVNNSTGQTACAPVAFSNSHPWP